MTDTPPPKRRFWQIHLSTAVVMMLVASGFVALNFTPFKLWGKAKGIGFPMIFRYWELDQEGTLQTHLNRGIWAPDFLLAFAVVAFVAYVCESYIRKDEEPFFRRVLIATGIFIVFGLAFFVFMLDYELRHK